MGVPEDTVNLKAEPKQDSKNFFNHVKEFVKDHFGTMTALFVSIGFIYTLTYTVKRNVPFPIDAPVVLYILMAFLAMLFTAALFGITFSPLYLSATKYFKDYQILYGDSKFLSLDGIFTFLKTFGYSVFFLAATMLLGMWFDSGTVFNYWFLTGLGFCYFVSATYVFIGMRHVDNWRAKAWNVVVTLFVSVAFQIWFFFMSLLLYAPFKDDNERLTVKLFIALCNLLLFCIVYLFSFPHKPKADNHPPNAKEKALGFLFFIGIFPVFINPVADFLANVAMKETRLGGDTLITLYFNKSDDHNIPAVLIEDDTGLISKELFLVMDVGSKIYVSLDTDKPRDVIAIDSGSVSSIDYGK